MKQAIGWQVVGQVMYDRGKSNLALLGEIPLSREEAERLAAKEEKDGGEVWIVKLVIESERVFHSL